MRSEGYSTRVCVFVCLSVKSHLTYGASVRPENAVTYSAGNEGQKICGDLPETTAFQSKVEWGNSVQGVTPDTPYSRVRNL